MRRSPICDGDRDDLEEEERANTQACRHALVHAGGKREKTTPTFSEGFFFKKRLRVWRDGRSAASFHTECVSSLTEG